MEFVDQYKKSTQLKITCDIRKNFKINNLLVGSGGSNNIILDLTDKSGDKYIIKIIPRALYINNAIIDPLEIKFYQFFTRKYLLTGRTPHIVGIYAHINCKNNIDKLLKNIKIKKPCLDMSAKLIRNENKQNKKDMINDIICDLLLRVELKMFDTAYDLVLVEYCSDDLGNMMQRYMMKIKNKNNEAIIDEFIAELSRILFQLIFTIAIIKNDYKGFIHNDFFIRNILISAEKKYTKNDYVAYHYNNKIFYLRANGSYAKINDFGTTVLVGELEPASFKLEENIRKYFNQNPYNEKNDIYNLLHDIYNGENLGARSLMTLMTDYRIPMMKMSKIIKFIKKFIDIKTMDKIWGINKGLLDRTWSIDKVTVLENTVKTPNEYLMGNIFARYHKLPIDGTVVRSFNASHKYNNSH